MRGRRRSFARRASAIALVVVALALAACTELRRRAYEPADRDEWQHPDAVVAALAIAPGAVVADLGSGGGYFSFRLAEATGPDGRVYAVDLDEGLNAHVEREANRRGLAQLRVLRAEADDPRLPEPVDLLFTCNTYHHIEARSAYFARVRRSLRPGGRLAIVEYRDAGWFARTFGHETEREVIETEMREAGFRLLAAHDFLPRQHFLIFEPAP